MKKAWEILMNVVKKITSSSVFWYVFFAGVAYFTWKKLSKPATVNFIDTPLPNNGTGIPQGWTPDDVANKFHDHFTSIWVNSSTLQILYTQCNAWTNDQFVQFVKLYNAKYAQIDGDTTLWARVKSWRSIWFGTGIDEQNKFINRMVALKQDY